MDSRNLERKLADLAKAEQRIRYISKESLLSHSFTPKKFQRIQILADLPGARATKLHDLNLQALDTLYLGIPANYSQNPPDQQRRIIHLPPTNHQDISHTDKVSEQNN